MPRIYTNKYQWLVKELYSRQGNDCWIWPFGQDKDGYGKMHLPGVNDRIRHVRAHRVSFYIHNGYWPVPCALHRCDNPSCFNPHHIFAGTINDNNQDMVIKGRYQRGEARPASKLTERRIRTIRAEYKLGLGRILGDKYSVSASTILVIVKGKGWKHVT